MKIQPCHHSLCILPQSCWLIPVLNRWRALSLPGWYYSMTEKYCVSICWSPDEILIVLLAEKTAKQDVTKGCMRNLLFVSSFSLQTCYPHLIYSILASTLRKWLRILAQYFCEKKNVKRWKCNCSWKFDVEIFTVLIFSSCCTPGIQEDGNRLLILVCVWFGLCVVFFLWGKSLRTNNL